jgi:hypothetical protein
MSNKNKPTPNQPDLIREDDPNTYVEYYFKDAGTRPWVTLLSGLPLPLDADGICRHRTFIRCEFHPVCDAVKFENCTFIDCEKPTTL